MQPSHSKDILFIDKDRTMGNVLGGADGPFDCYPGLRAFLGQMGEAQRRIYVATTAGKEGLKHLEFVQDLLSGYFGNEEIGTMDPHRYIDENGRVRQIKRDFVKRRDQMTPKVRAAMETSREKIWKEIDKIDSAIEGTELEERRKRSRWISDRLESAIHVRTGFPLERYEPYQNPYMKRSYPSKDLHLARLHIAPRSPERLKCVMIGDGADRGTVASDPLTPLIVISERVRLGEWHLVRRVVDELFSSQEAFPHQQFEAMIGGGNRGVWVSSQGFAYPLERGTLQEQRIYCP